MPRETGPSTPQSARITMYATPWCGDCRMARRWFETHGIPYDHIDITKDEHTAAYVMQVNGGMRSVPTILFPDGSILVEPSARQLAAKCSLGPAPPLRERVKHIWRLLMKKEADRTTVCSVRSATPGIKKLPGSVFEGSIHASHA